MNRPATSGSSQKAAISRESLPPCQASGASPGSSAVSDAPEMLSAQGLSTTVADARFARPLDADLIERLAKEHEVLITIEEGARGGFGSFVLEHLANAGALDAGLKIRIMTLPDVFQDQDSPFAMYETAGHNARHIAARAIEALGRGDISAIERTASA